MRDSVDETLAGRRIDSPERRKRSRFLVDGFAEVIVRDAGFLYRGAIQELRPTGCYIKSKGYLSVGPGAEVELRFSVNDFHFNTPAKVRSVRRGAGAAFDFLHIEESILKRLEELIAKLSGPTVSVSATKPE